MDATSEHWRESIGLVRGFMPDDPLNARDRFLEIEQQLRALISERHGSSPELERLAAEVQYLVQASSKAAARWQDQSRQREQRYHARESSPLLRH